MINDGAKEKRMKRVLQEESSVSFYNDSQQWAQVFLVNLNEEPRPLIACMTQPNPPEGHHS